MPRPALLPPIAVLALVLAGCDPAVQARYHPTTVEEVYGPLSHVSGVVGQVYELPAAPPATGEGDVSPRSCLAPGQAFKSTATVGLREDSHPRRTLEPTALVAMHDEPPPSPRPGRPYALYGWQPAMQRGAKESLGQPDFNPRSEPGHSLYRNEPVPKGAWRDDTWSWCDDDANLR